MELHAWSADRLNSRPLPGPAAVVRFADCEELLAPIHDRDNARLVLDVICGDVTADDGGLRAANADDAKRIVDFCRQAKESGRVQHLVAQCQAGVGRSVALVGALADKSGQHWRRNGAHNRRLYALLRAELGLPLVCEPLVSLAVRVKYSLEHLAVFLSSLHRQRYDNWEAVCFTDGDRPDLRAAWIDTGGKIRLLENPEPRGRWGHPYRQAALEQCRGEWIGTNNDDNYLTPGYLEQLVYEGEQAGASLVLCHAVHRYSGWSVCQVGDDLACWLAKRELVRQVPWDDYSFHADKRYLQRLIDVAGGKFAVVSKPLVVKN